MAHLHKLIIILSIYTVFSAPRRPRLSLAEFMPQYFVRNINGNPDTYSFGYDISDPNTGNFQYRSEERYPNGTVVGSYGFVDPTGAPRTYNYVADEKGYRIVNIQSKNNQAGYEANNQVKYPLPDSEESTITWARPKKPSKKKDDDNLTKPNDLNMNFNNIQSGPPSYLIPY